MEKAQGFCEQGGYTVNTQGLLSTTRVQRSFVSCTATVYISGTLTLATIFADNALVPTPKANPFTSSVNGEWFFYAAGGKYDVRFSGSDVPLAFTRGDWLLCDPFGPNQDLWCSNTSTFPHNLLSDTHPDTVPFSPPNVGDLIRGNLFNRWERLGVAQVGEVLTLIDVGGGVPYPEWVWPSTLDTCTSVQVNGVESGCEHELNFTGGNVTVVATDDSANDRTNIAITASGGTLACDPTSVTDLYVATTGNDTTGDGSIGNPWLTIQHAIDVGVPVFVGGKYYIHLVDAGTYAGFTYASRTDCGGGFQCSISPPDNPFATGLAVIGSTDGVASDTWIINSAIVVDGMKLYLQGVMVSDGAIGLTAQNHAQVALGAVNFFNNHLGLLAATWSQVYLQPGVYVNDDFSTALATLDNFVASSDGFEVTEDSVITDSCPDGNNVPLGTELDCVATGTGKFSIACIEGKKGQIYMRDDVVIDLSGGVDTSTYGVKSLDSHFAMARFTYTGNAGNGRGIGVFGGRVSGGALGGGVYNITTAAIGVQFTEGGQIDELPSFASVTKNFSSPYDATKAGTNFVGYGGVTFDTPYAATPTFDMQNGTTQKMTLTGNVTASTITNAVDGMILTLEICQDGFGAHTFVFDANLLGATAIGATASKCNVQRFMYDGTAGKWYAIGTMQQNM
jgi:hypothetical protein